MPQFIRQRGNVLLFGFKMVFVVAVPAPRLLMLRLCEQVGRIGVLQGLSGVFMSREVNFFSVALCASPMGVGGQVPVFSSYLL